MKNAHTKKNQKGFSLVELMLVIAVVGILAMIGVPKYANSKANADGSIVGDHMRGLVAASAQWELMRGTLTGMTCMGLIENNMVMSGLKSCNGTAPSSGNFTVASTGRTITITATNQTAKTCVSAVNYLSSIGEEGVATCNGGTVTLVYRMS